MMDRAQVMYTNQPTASLAIAQWSHHYHQLEQHPDLSDPATVSFDERGCGLGREYRNLITYRIVVVRYRYSARGHWRVGYVGYAPTRQATK